MGTPLEIGPPPRYTSRRRLLTPRMLLAPPQISIEISPDFPIATRFIFLLASYVLLAPPVILQGFLGSSCWTILAGGGIPGLACEVLSSCAFAAIGSLQGI